MNRVKSRISVVLASNEVALAKEIEPLQPQLLQTNDAVQDCTKQLSSARSAQQTAREALDAVTAAWTATPTEALDAAKTEAAAEYSAAQTAAGEAKAALSRAESQFEELKSPFAALTRIAEVLRVMRFSEGYLAGSPRSALRFLSPMLAQAKAKHDQIGPSEAEVSRLEAALKLKQNEVQAAQTAKHSIDTAASKSSNPSIARAVTAAGELLEVRQGEETGLQQDLVAARQTLYVALLPVNHLVNLEKALKEAIDLAEELDAAYHQSEVERRAQAARDAQYERDNDPCTCSETNCPCSYCSNKRSDWDIERDNDPTR